MRKSLTAILLFVTCCCAAQVQEYNQLTDDGRFTQSSMERNGTSRDTLKHTDKEIPKGLKVWTIDERFGDRVAAQPDTLQHMFMNSVFTTGLRSEYNTTGNLGAPRINRIFTDRQQTEQFWFTQPYDYFVTPVNQFLFTNTLSPITNLSYNECGDRTNGEDHFKALFGVNVGKRIGLGFKFDYIYGRGYYQNQSTSHFNYSLYGSYMGDRYNAHLLVSLNHQKVAENGGITDDRYITHPEIFTDEFRENEIPTALEQNWNRNDNQHIFFSHRYNIGFNRKVKMTKEEIEARKFAMQSQKDNANEKAEEKERKKALKEGRTFDASKFNSQKNFSGRPDGAAIAGNEPSKEATADTTRMKVDANSPGSVAMAKEQAAKADTSWMKNEYVPVTSFIHTASFDNYRRIYQAYATPDNFYANAFSANEKLSGDSIFDKTTHYSLKNTVALALLEGFNKWAKAGIKVFATHELRHFEMPDSANRPFNTYNEHNISIGGQISKTMGRTLHYNLTAETWLAGEDAGQMKIDSNADLNFRLFNDTVQLAAKAWIYRLAPVFYNRHYHSKHFWWDNDNLDKETRTHIEGTLNIMRTKTRLRAAFDMIKNYTYLSQQYAIADDFTRSGSNVTVRQCGDNATMLTLQLSQDFRFGPVCWENQITYQKASNEDVMPVPAFNLYSNLYLTFKIAKVLKVHLGGDIRYFSEYYAPDYSPALGQYTVQGNGEHNVKTGNYPIVNVYANMHLKHTRFFIMMSHVNASSGNYFLTPHYPINSSVLRFGVSWNFFN